MANWRNITDHSLTVYPRGPQHPEQVAPGEVLTLSKEQDHIIGTHTGHHQFEKVELEIKVVEKPKPEVPKSDVKVDGQKVTEAIKPKE